MVVCLIISIVLLSITLGIVGVLVFESVLKARQQSKILPKKKELKIEKKIISKEAKIDKLIKDRNLLLEIKKGDIENE